MGTKQSPSPNDPYQRAEADEPLFTLLARDMLAPGHVRLYAALLARNWSAAEAIFNGLVSTARRRPFRPSKDAVHIGEARECADQMDRWFDQREQSRLSAEMTGTNGP